MKIELVHVPNCPHVAAARSLLVSCLEDLGIAAAIEERVDAYPSPTILIDGRDVMGEPAAREAACRLDVPTRERVIAALTNRE